ncbi:magnesium transporter [Coprinopsis sp. MPI-PUGE-AT-0042]|nr:magnesium transporter [Coprinopsis sp. MPI-PUGE-AT-0042]
MHSALWRHCAINVKGELGAKAYLTGAAQVLSRQNSHWGQIRGLSLLQKSKHWAGTNPKGSTRRLGLSHNAYLARSARGIAWLSKAQQKTPLEEEELPDTEEEAARAAILDKVMKGRQPSELMLRCTVLDAEGNVKTISGQFKKTDICSEHCLHARDLRKIDSRVPNLVPTILARKEAVLINILHIRALVKTDAVVLFDTYGSADSRLHSVFLYHLEPRGQALPYEFRAIESILLSVLSALEAEMVFIRNLVGGLLAEMEDNIDRDRFKRLLHYSRRLVSFKNRAKLVEEALDEVLSQDEDMNAMHLTDKKNGIIRELNDHEELETLLESFSKQVEEIVNEAENIEANVQSTQEIVELILDSNRNALLTLDLKVSIATLGIGTGALVAGLFGMNLTSHIETHPYAFYVLSAGAAGIAVLVAWLGLRNLARIRRIGLSNPGRPARKPYLPLPLRKRDTGGWS